MTLSIKWRTYKMTLEYELATEPLDYIWKVQIFAKKNLKSRICSIPHKGTSSTITVCLAKEKETELF
jgi:hypothetical protein